VASKVDSPVLRQELPSLESFTIRHGYHEVLARRLHFHRHFELWCPCRGSGRFVVGSAAGHWRAGEAYLLAPLVAHTFYTDDAASPADAVADRAKSAPWDPTTRPGQRDAAIDLPYEATLVFFSGDALHAAAQALPELRSFGPLLESASAGLVFRGSGARQAVRMLLPAVGKQNVFGLSHLLLALDMLSSQAQSYRLGTPQQSPEWDSSNDQRMEKLYAFIQEHLDDVRLEDVAHHVGLSIPALCSMFRRNTGYSVLRYVQTMRISRACALLSETDMPITTVGLECGFNTLSSFNRQFKQLCGTTPREYRKRHQHAR
jgi:AraC-like DNA-binding protein